MIRSDSVWLLVPGEGRTDLVSTICTDVCAKMVEAMGPFSVVDE